MNALDLSYAHVLAYRLSIAIQLGGDFGYQKEAEDIINNKMIEPSMMLNFEKESNDATQWLKEEQLTSWTNDLFDELIRFRGY
jgi:hypothetical protein